MGGPHTGPGSFATAFDEALSAAGTTLAALRGRLADRGYRVASSTLGYWRSGQRQPERTDSLEAVAEIEAILNLRTGTLTGAIGASRRSGPPIPQVDVDELPDMSPAMKEALAQLGMDSLRPGHVEESLDITADIAADGSWTRMSSRSRLRATADGVSRSAGFCMSAPGQTATSIVLDAGGTLGRQVRMDEHGLLVAELVLDRPMDVGGTAMVEYTFTFDGNEDDLELGTYAANRLSHVSAWARFSPERTPRRGYVFTQLTGEDAVLTEVDVAGRTSLHLALRAFGPGLMGIRWEW